MKKNIIALAIASAVAAPVAMADAPTLYGQINMAVDQMSVDGTAGVKDKSASGTQINSRSSRLGVKGSEDLGNGLKAVYKLEFGVDVGGTGNLSNRNQYVGLAGGFGTVLMGRHNTPLKMAQGKDFFNWSPTGDIKKMSGGLGALGQGGENRLSNVLAYVSPSFSGVTLMGAFIPKESDGSTKDESSLTDVMSFAAMYGSKKKGLYLAAAMDVVSKEFNGDLTGATESADNLRLVAQYAAGGLIANVMYQDFGGKAIEDSLKEGTTISAGLGYKVGKLTPKLQVMQVDREKDGMGNKAEDSMNYALGLDYSLGKKTTAYAEYAMLENADGYNNTKAEKTSFSVGLLHKF